MIRSIRVQNPFARVKKRIASTSFSFWPFARGIWWGVLSWVNVKKREGLPTTRSEASESKIHEPTDEDWERQLIEFQVWATMAEDEACDVFYCKNSLYSLSDNTFCFMFLGLGPNIKLIMKLGHHRVRRCRWAWQRWQRSRRSMSEWALDD